MSTFLPPTPGTPQRVAANEETTVLTPVTDGTGALDRLPVSVRRRWIVVCAILATLLIGAIAFIVYLWNVTEDWEAQVGDVTAQNYELGNRIALAEAEGEDLQAELDTVSEQLDTAMARITELADETAQSGDTAEYYASAIADLLSLQDAASSVSATLVRCIEVQGDLVAYLKDAENYDATELATYESQVNDVCDNAVAAHVELQALLDEQ